MKDTMRNELGAPTIVDRSPFQTELDVLRVREKAHTTGGDAIAAARRRLPMVEVDGDTPRQALNRAVPPRRRAKGAPKTVSTFRSIRKPITKAEGGRT
jgi:hypothetical protein